VKTSVNVPLTSQGTDAAKKIVGRKRGILTDTIGRKHSPGNRGRVARGDLTLGLPDPLSVPDQSSSPGSALQSVTATRQSTHSMCTAPRDVRTDYAFAMACSK
jgi:hypothetical protein